jgi:RNA polymerase sigma-70 factor (ECF subfamily)
VVSTGDYAARSDTELLALWCDGDRRAGDALTRRHYEPLYSAVRRRIGDGELAAEIVNDTFRIVVQQREQIREAQRFRGYLHCIAHRQLCDRLRSRYRDPDFDVEMVSAAAATGSLAGAVNDRIDAKLLYRALRELPLEQQFTLELYTWEDLTAPDIAALMNVSLAQVRHRIRLGKERLAALITAYRVDPSIGLGDTGELLTWFGHLRDRAQRLGDVTSAA